MQKFSIHYANIGSSSQRPVYYFTEPQTSKFCVSNTRFTRLCNRRNVPLLERNVCLCISPFRFLSQVLQKLSREFCRVIILLQLAKTSMVHRSSLTALLKPIFPLLLAPSTIKGYKSCICRILIMSDISDFSNKNCFSF